MNLHDHPTALPSITKRRTAARFVPAILLLSMFGCGTTREYNATQQLVMSDAVDRSISSIDFRPLAGQRVYLDTSYLQHIKVDSFVNADYVTSSMRQQIVGAGCLIQDSSSEADIIIEARIGTLGTDDHRVTFGIPENNTLSSAASFVPGAPSVPSIPEIAIAKREARKAASKVAAFAYNRETREAVWQSGVSPSISTARDTWVLGVGPIQSGTVKRGSRFAGLGGVKNENSQSGSPPGYFDRPTVEYTAQTRFNQGWPILNRGNSNPNAPGMLDESVLSEPIGSQVAETADDGSTVTR